MATAGGHQEAVNLLLTWEADIEAKNRIGSTPLIRAVSNDQLDIVKRLLKEGASINARNKMGNTPLHCAAFLGSIEMAKLLIEAQATVNLQQGNLYGATPLMIASKQNVALLKYFLSTKNLPIDSKNDEPNVETKSNKRSSLKDFKQQQSSDKKLDMDNSNDLDISRVPAPSISKEEDETTRSLGLLSLENPPLVRRDSPSVIPEETNKLLDNSNDVELATW